MDFKKYKRFFAFGCSMTRYRWPTWADIISQEIPEFHNYGKSGGGNLYISNSIVEANIKHKFNSNDLVIIMWSSTTREDRYKNGWKTPGNILTQGEIDMEFVYKWYDERFYLIRDLGLIELTKNYLDSNPADSFMLSMSPFKEQKIEDNIKGDTTADIIDFYKETISNVKPNLCDTVFNGVWPQIPIKGYNGKGQTADYHPSPEGHLEYVEKIFGIDSITDNMKNFATKYEKMVRQSSTFNDLEKFWQENDYGDRL